jgi:hypothetical protein
LNELQVVAVGYNPAMLQGAAVNMEIVVDVDVHPSVFFTLTVYVPIGNPLKTVLD